jgi:hypothetical protein
MISPSRARIVVRQSLKPATFPCPGTPSSNPMYFNGIGGGCGGPGGGPSTGGSVGTGFAAAGGGGGGGV